jgi:CheY-like chemotaxis protein
MLVRLGIDVVSADNGIEALEILNNRTFDLCLMDIQMPKMDGYRATAEIRKHVNPTVREIPVIALTASAFLSEREKAKLFGMNDHVGKPFAPEELLEKITNCLAIHRGEMDDPSAIAKEKEVKNS